MTADKNQPVLLSILLHSKRSKYYEGRADRVEVVGVIFGMDNARSNWEIIQTGAKATYVDAGEVFLHSHLCMFTWNALMQRSARLTFSHQR